MGIKSMNLSFMMLAAILYAQVQAHLCPHGFDTQAEHVAGALHLK